MRGLVADAAFFLSFPLNFNKGAYQRASCAPIRSHHLSGGGGPSATQLVLTALLSVQRPTKEHTDMKQERCTNFLFQSNFHVGPPGFDEEIRHSYFVGCAQTQTTKHSHLQQEIGHDANLHLRVHDFCQPIKNGQPLAATLVVFS